MYSHPVISVKNIPLNKMNKFTVCALVALVGCAFAEPPGYNYNRPSGGGGGGFSSSFSSGFSSGGSSGLLGGGGYRSVSSGHQTSEGQQVDPQLLEQVKQILLREESNAGATGGFSGGHGGGGVSSQYGVPSSSYGVPSYSSRVVGIDLEGIRQAIQVAQYEQASASSSGGYAAARTPSGSYGAPF